MNRKINNNQQAGPKGVSLVFIFLGLDIYGSLGHRFKNKKLYFHNVQASIINAITLI